MFSIHKWYRLLGSHAEPSSLYECSSLYPLSRHSMNTKRVLLSQLHCMNHLDMNAKNHHLSSQRRTKKSCYIVIKSMVFDVTRFIATHPGGESGALPVLVFLCPFLCLMEEGVLRGLSQPSNNFHNPYALSESIKRPLKAENIHACIQASSMLFACLSRGSGVHWRLQCNAGDAQTQNLRDLRVQFNALP